MKKCVYLQVSMNVRIYRFFVAAAIAAVAAVSCAKNTGESSQDAGERSLKAFMQVHYPGVDTTASGIYIIEDLIGSGNEVVDSNYLFVEFEQRVLEDSTLVSYTSEELAKQTGKYSKSAYYGQEVVRLLKSTMAKGVYEIFTGGTNHGRMKTGGTRTAVLPSWLAPTSSNNVIYKMQVNGQVENITEWEIGQIEKYLDLHKITKPDTTGLYGFYFLRDEAREKRRGVKADMSYEFPKDTTVYINYVGRLASSGKVFDTNIKDTAKVWGIYSAAATYTPSAVTWSSDSTALKLGGSTVIPGFYHTLWKMHPFESATSLFISDLGYTDKGSGNSIKGYMPLVFEIDIVKKDDE